jgi:hypothetical protein
MHALVRGAIGAATLSALAALASAELARAPDPATATAGSTLLAGCPPRTVPDGAACTPVPALGVVDSPARATAGAHELIARGPERPEDLARYVPPFGAVAAHLDPDGALVSQGAQGHAVRAIALEHQEGAAELRFAGDLDGPTLITFHTVQERGRVRRYLVAITGLSALAPNLLAGSPLAEGERLGTAGASLRVAIRQLRDNVDPERVAPKKLLASSVSVVTDPRNVLRLAAAP